jgi:hypothetical protein
MPCDSVTESQVNLGKVDLNRWTLAGEELGYRVKKTKESVHLSKNGISIIVQKGQEKATVFTVNTINEVAIVAQIKRTYAAKTVIEATQKFGWKMQQYESPSDQSRITMKLRR